jgi:hypothetical protein
MKAVSRLICCVSLLGAGGFAQATQPPATQNELKYFEIAAIAAWMRI